LREVLAKSFRRVVRRGVHQALDHGDGREWGTVASIAIVSVERAEENHWSSWLGEGVSGGGGASQSLSFSVRPGQSASCQRGRGWSCCGVGGRMLIRMVAWSDPVEGRDDASQERNAGNMCGLAKARSMVLGLWVPEKGTEYKRQGC